MASGRAKAPGSRRPQGPAVSAQEVAARAKVSAMTVSRVFTGSATVSERTRGRVLRAARSLGYQPNVAARTLRTRRVEVVGFLLRNHSALQGIFHAEALAAFEAAMAARKLSVILSIPPPGEALAAWATQLRGSGRCGGLVVQSDELTADDLRDLGMVSGPIVLMNHTPEPGRGRRIPASVGFDNMGGVEQVVRHLVALGHRRLAFIGGTPSHHDAAWREQGFRRAIATLGLPPAERWIRPGHFHESFEAGVRQTEHLIAEGASGPTAIICASDEIAMGALDSARRCGVDVPRGLSVTGFDNVRHVAYTSPPLTTVEHSGWNLGTEVAEVLLRQLDGDETRPEHRVLPTSLVVRGSTARARDGEVAVL